MSIHVGVKGIREGLLVTLDEGAWEDVLPALMEHLDSQPEFFQGAKLILRVGGIPLHAADLARLRSDLFDRGISLRTVLSDHAPTVTAAQALGLETALPVAEARESPLDSSINDASAVFLRQTMRSGNSVQYPGHVVVVGDVNPGAEIVAGGSVVVWGRLRGTVHAGAQGEESAVVCALELAPMQMWIAGFNAPPSDTPHAQPRMASLRDGRIDVEAWSPK